MTEVSFVGKREAVPTCCSLSRINVHAPRCIEGGPRGVHGGVDIGGGRMGDIGNGLARCGVVCREGLLSGGRNPPIVAGSQLWMFARELT